MKNPFQLFDLPIDFNLDQNLLAERYLALQKSLHPDNFSASSAQEQRLALQKCAEINDGFQALKDPISRADCIIALQLGEQNLEEKSNRDMAFLMQQMEWREKLEHIEQDKSEADLFAFADEISQQWQQIITQLASALAEQQWQQAQHINDRLRFIKKLQVEIERIEDQLLDF